MIQYAMIAIPVSSDQIKKIGVYTKQVHNVLYTKCTTKYQWPTTKSNLNHQ